jgi:hypothetical protein
MLKITADDSLQNFGSGYNYSLLTDRMALVWKSRALCLSDEPLSESFKVKPC